jgi:hypothetical protein
MNNRPKSMPKILVEVASADTWSESTKSDFLSSTRVFASRMERLILVQLENMAKAATKTNTCNADFFMYKIIKVESL